MFFGDYDLDKAESWMHELEHTFETMECAEEDQGDLIVTRYHQRFVRLLRHVPHVAGSEQACAERFIAGLRPDLRWGVTAHMCATLGEAMAKATALERETWQPQQQQQGGASSRTSSYQRPANSRGSATSSSSGLGSSGSSDLRSKFRQMTTHRDGVGSRSISRGAYNVDATWHAIAFWFSWSSMFDRFWCRTGAGGRDMVTTFTGVATWLLSRQPDPSCLGGHRFKTKAGGVLMEFGMRRRWPFRREGSNGSALLLEGLWGVRSMLVVRLLSSGRARIGQRRKGGSHRSCC
ncbi:hypothetical protein Taro_054010 [Colocasia esculenta]|uniref:Retrotransposon gag domain-containing protein n=1 Tax=Colocasia esculenta TaxID=4460 RepID=A0A843XPF7_COLES|nr:hypothetical protein [Colocasia esculenta]